ncbi:hypothetical protein WH95_19630 [Kiloniella litopenaei]|uniref:Uncharacterized protein n=1 Tax=Kiloniella litopenaei TaxID=1549748 RepID=A0A0M2R5H5_9PROT|nr:hypothetical protein [Kiloniella litopenaei]KKJ75230.1 hypothetical protein WH95_19630 [Kiloniella litopenaei]
MGYETHDGKFGGAITLEADLKASLNSVGTSVYYEKTGLFLDGDSPVLTQNLEGDPSVAVRTLEDFSITLQCPLIPVDGTDDPDDWIVEKENNTIIIVSLNWRIENNWAIKHRNLGISAYVNDYGDPKVNRKPHRNFYDIGKAYNTQNALSPKILSAIRFEKNDKVSRNYEIFTVFGVSNGVIAKADGITGIVLRDLFTKNWK